VTEAEVAGIGEGLLDRTLAPAIWTHAAHLAATVYLLTRRPELDLARELPRLIRVYNDATGVPNTDTHGYHETLTQFYLRAIAAFLARMPRNLGVAELANRLIASRFGQRDFPLTFYSRERLFSVAARRGWVEPDLAPFDFERTEVELAG
jgi:hypothetical protein